MAADYRVHLVNTSAVKQYEGLKHTDDYSDTFCLAHSLRLGILPTGYICPKPTRSVRDLLCKRGQLVRQRTSHILSIHNLYARNTGSRLSNQVVKHLTKEQVQDDFEDSNLVLAIESNRSIMKALNAQIKVLEHAIILQAKLDPRYRYLLSIGGIGPILALTIMLETGKKKGKGNTKNGNKHLSWAFVEAANFAIRFNDQAKRFYQRKMAKRNRVVAIKAVAHKLARASYYVMRDQVPFDSAKLFT